MCAALLLPNCRDAFLRLSQLPSLRDRRFYSAILLAETQECVSTSFRRTHVEIEKRARDKKRSTAYPKKMPPSRNETDGFIQRRQHPGKEALRASFNTRTALRAISYNRHKKCGHADLDGLGHHFPCEYISTSRPLLPTLGLRSLCPDAFP